MKMNLRAGIKENPLGGEIKDFRLVLYGLRK